MKHPRTAEEFQKARQAKIAKLLNDIGLSDKRRKSLAREIDIALLPGTYGIGVGIGVIHG